MHQETSLEIDFKAFVHLFCGRTGFGFRPLHFRLLSVFDHYVSDPGTTFSFLITKRYHFSKIIILLFLTSA